MEILSDRLAVCAAYITTERVRYLSRLFELVNDSLSEMTQSAEQASFSYLSGINGKCAEDFFDLSENTDAYRRLFSKDVQREIVMGTSLGGAHRDDFEILLNGMNAKFFASQGQQRSLALAMKLAEGEISKENTGEYPVFLLDDVLSELDRERKKYVLSELKERQVILTTCDESDFAGISSANMIYVENGHYSYR
jgi:DNA replication and repair protein RecF